MYMQPENLNEPMLPADFFDGLNLDDLDYMLIDDYNPEEVEPIFRLPNGGVEYRVKRKRKPNRGHDNSTKEEWYQ